MTCLSFGYSLLKFSIEMNEGFLGAWVGLGRERASGTPGV
jgi:hypothetical protein